MDGSSQLQGVASLAYLGVLLFAFVYVMVRALQDRKRIWPLMPRSLALGVPLLLLSLCSVWFGYRHTDYGQILRALDIAEPLIRSQVPIMANLYLGAGVVGALLSSAYMMLVMSTSETELQSAAFPMLLRRQPSPGVPLGMAVGLLCAGVSLPLFSWMRVGVSSVVEQQNAMLFPDVDFDAPVVVLTATLPAMISAAVGEEVLFRGLILRGLRRFFGEGRAAVVGAVVFTAFLWSLGHAVNTDQLGLKLAQIFVVGLLFGWLSVRHSVESALAAHLVFNAAIVCWFLLV